MHLCSDEPDFCQKLPDFGPAGAGAKIWYTLLVSDQHRKCNCFAEKSQLRKVLHLIIIITLYVRCIFGSTSASVAGASNKLGE